jgi:hypothetical protein
MGNLGLRLLIVGHIILSNSILVREWSNKKAGLNDPAF